MGGAGSGYRCGCGSLAGMTLFHIFSSSAGQHLRTICITKQTLRVLPLFFFCFYWHTKSNATPTYIGVAGTPACKLAN